MLCLLTTPINDKIKSPMKLLIGRKAKSNLPIILLNKHEDRDCINDSIKKQQNEQKIHHNNQFVK